MGLPRKLLIVGLLSFVSLALIECLECSDSYDLPKRLSLLPLKTFYDKVRRVTNPYGDRELIFEP